MNEIGAAFFGVVVGYITYRTLARTADKAAISDLVAVIGAIGGGAITKLYEPGTTAFAWYAIGLLIGMAIFFGLYFLLNGRVALTHVMGITKAEQEREVGPNGPTGV